MSDFDPRAFGAKPAASKYDPLIEAAEALAPDAEATRARDIFDEIDPSALPKAKNLEDTAPVQRVEVPGKGVMVFPAGVSEERMANAVRAAFPELAFDFEPIEDEVAQKPIEEQVYLGFIPKTEFHKFADNALDFGAQHFLWIAGIAAALVVLRLWKRARRWAKSEVGSIILREHAKWIIVGTAAVLCVLLHAITSRYSGLNTSGGVRVVDRWTGHVERAR